MAQKSEIHVFEIDILLVALVALVAVVVIAGPIIPKECSDGVDNDKDGLIDYPKEPDCFNAKGNSESNVVIDTKSNGLNKGVSQNDYIASVSNIVSNPNVKKTECNDGKDNDADGKIDLGDIGCSSPDAHDETNCGDRTCEIGSGTENAENCPIDCKGVRR